MDQQTADLAADLERRLASGEPVHLTEGTHLVLEGAVVVWWCGEDYARMGSPAHAASYIAEMVTTGSLAIAGGA